MARDVRVVVLYVYVSFGVSGIFSTFFNLKSWRRPELNCFFSVNPTVVAKARPNTPLQLNTFNLSTTTFHLKCELRYTGASAVNTSTLHPFYCFKASTSSIILRHLVMSFRPAMEAVVSFILLLP